jgi:hypothetical protein
MSDGTKRQRERTLGDALDALQRGVGAVHEHGPALRAAPAQLSVEGPGAHRSEHRHLPRGHAAGHGAGRA